MPFILPLSGQRPILQGELAGKSITCFADSSKLLCKKGFSWIARQMVPYWLHTQFQKQDKFETRRKTISKEQSQGIEISSKTQICCFKRKLFKSEHQFTQALRIQGRM